MESLASWTDDIPICKQAGIGTANNEIYRKDGRRVEMHSMQDRYFHFCQEEGELNLSLYGLFDGFKGANVSDFAVKRMPAEILLGQLKPNMPDASVREILRQAFLNVDREYFESIMKLITRRIVLIQDPKISLTDSSVREVNEQVSIGASAVIAVLLNEKLFVAGCGDTRAVLCLKLPNGDLKVMRLSVDHILGNEDEDLRLKQLGIDLKKVESLLAPPGYTRCLGFHRIKGGFKEEEALQAAKDEPVISEPEILGGVSLESSFQFLLLFTRSLTDCLTQVGSFEGDPVLELCRITLEQFSENTTVSGVAQSVVDQVTRRHREQFEMEEEPELVIPSVPLAVREREDITLLVRKFNAKLKRKRSSNANINLAECNVPMMGMANGRRPEDTVTTSIREGFRHNRLPTQSSTTTESSDVFFDKNMRDLPIDEDGCIQPYVDFSHFYQEWNKYKEQHPDSEFQP